MQFHQTPRTNYHFSIVCCTPAVKGNLSQTCKIGQFTSPCDVALYGRTPAAPSVPTWLCESLWTGLGGDGGENWTARPRFRPEGLNYHSSPRVAFGLANCSMKWPQEQCKPPRNRPLTVSQQCSLCVKIVKAGPFRHRSCLSFEPQLWTNKAGLKVCMMVSEVAGEKL